MKNFNYNYLSPFKWFTLENFPFIEADFDAITNYQLYCKIVEYLNKVIKDLNQIGEQTELLTNQIEELKNYIDNYFNNLDVQDEINNKLDQMVLDGTMAEIINEEIFSELNAKINLLNSNTDLLHLYAPSLLNSLGSESIALITDNTNSILFDTGRETSVTANKTYLQSKLGTNKINSVIISHYHGDHVGGIKGLKDLYDDDVIVYLPLDFTNYYNGTDDIPTITNIRQDIINWLIANSITYVEVDTDLLLDYDNFSVQLRNSTPQAYTYYNTIETPKYNTYSMNALVDFQGNKILFPGDSTVVTQNYLMTQDQVEKVNVYASGHHGYERYTNAKYIEILNPDFEYFSVSPLSWDSITLLQYDYGMRNKPIQYITEAYNDIEINISRYGNIATKGDFTKENMFPNKVYNEIYIDSSFNGIPDGSNTAPFKSIAQALTYLPNYGANVHFYLVNGDYSNLRFVNLYNIITIEAINTGQVNFSDVQVYNCSNIFFKGITFTNETLVNCSNVYFNTCTLQAGSTDVGNISVEAIRSQIYIYGSTLNNCYTGLYAHNNTNASITNSTFNCATYSIYGYEAYISYDNITLTSGVLRSDNGCTIQTIARGTTGQRPTFGGSTYMRGYQYFDTTIGKPIFYYNSGVTDRWILADGTEV